MGPHMPLQLTNPLFQYYNNIIMTMSCMPVKSPALLVLSYYLNANRMPLFLISTDWTKVSSKIKALLFFRVR